MSEWISINERLPVIDMNAAPYVRCVNVLAVTNTRSIVFLSYVSNGYAKTEKGREPRFEWMGRICPFVLTHWMPLPEAPTL